MNVREKNGDIRNAENIHFRHSFYRIDEMGSSSIRLLHNVNVCRHMKTMFTSAGDDAEAKGGMISFR